jgi:hypothetical protein
MSCDRKIAATLICAGKRCGMGGLGKTTLAVHVAHRLTDHYPDGQIVVDMAGTSTAPLSPAQGMARIIRAFEPLMQLPEGVTELQPVYLSVLRGKRVLLILDNALDGDQVAPLAPPENCALIVTSRRKIAVTGLVRVDLDLLAPEEATGLLHSIMGDGRATAAELSRIAELCGLLPLALRIASMFLAASPPRRPRPSVGPHALSPEAAAGAHVGSGPPPRSASPTAPVCAAARLSFCGSATSIPSAC